MEMGSLDILGMWRCCKARDHDSEVTSRGVLMTSRGVLMTSRDVVMTSCCDMARGSNWYLSCSSS